MAEETPDNIVEEVQGAASGAAAGDAAEAAPAPAAPAGQTRRERLEARRAARRPAARAERTPEERDAERRARRAETAKQRRAYRAKLKQRRSAARTEEPTAAVDHAPEHGPGRPKVRQGVVFSAKADKTIAVRIDVVQRHRRYRKTIRSTVKLYAHDRTTPPTRATRSAVVECRPMSRSKRWRLTDVLERAR